MNVSLGTPVADGPPLTDVPTRFGAITMSDPGARRHLARTADSRFSTRPPKPGRVSAIIIGSAATQSH
jgi:hypothetical protein